jgi:serine/threonine protein kinase
MLHDRERTNHLLYRFGHITDSVARRRVFDRFIKTAHLDHPHILKIERVGYDDTGRLCVITDYPGNQEGLVTLGDLLEVRGGRLEFQEAIRLMGQLLESCVHASEQGIVHGPFTMDELLVDRHGCTLVELFGLRQAMHNQYSIQDARSEQTRSIIEIGYRLATGVQYSDVVSSSNASRPSKFTKRNEKLWDTWFALALDPVNGFETSQQAIDTMPTDPEQISRLAELKPMAPAQRSKPAPIRKTGAVFARFRRSSESRKD